jgi:hypothetical protein
MGAGLWTKDVKQNVSKYKEWKSLKGERRIEWGRRMNGKGSSKRWVGNEGKGKIGGRGSSTYQSQLIMLMLKGELLCSW